MSATPPANRRRRSGARAVGATAVLVASALALSGCVQSQRTESGNGGGSVNSTFVFAASSDPKTLDPAFASDGESFRVSRQVFEGLVGTKPGTADPAPLLAESWKTSADGLTNTFELKKGVKFQDGTAFNAAAVCANFDRWYNFKGIQQSENLAYYYTSLFKGYKDKPQNAVYKSCTASGDNQATVTLAKPFAGFIASLSLPAFGMQSPTAMQKYSANTVAGTADSPQLSEYAKGHPVGTGPYKLDKWDVGQQIELSSYDGYWGDKGQVKKIIFRVIDDANARRQALESGSIDGYDLVAPADTQSLKNKGMKVIQRDPFNILYLGFNQAKKELKDVRVRQAIAYAIDKDALVKQTLPEGTKVANQFVPESVNGYNKDVTTYPTDKNKAKELLKEAGYPNGFTIDFNYPTNVSRPYMPTPEQTFTNLSAQLAEVGIKVNPKPLKWSPDYLDKVQGTADHGIHLLGWTGDYNDTDNFVGVFFGHEKPEFGFTNQSLFDELTKARGVSKLEQQTPLYEKINDDIMKYVPGIPLAHPAPSLGFASRVESYPASPVQDEVFNEIKLTS
ncbi:ABC transporter substrate-binding protein [Tersicoccus sp. Bi-70]|uniref:ABC transporter substrate-binding protein n=1 Tax=Tersicoccus sp. Bi-70 TaxID=1897634 RepID=UPI0009F8D546|nr:ABC transporter substrate-binding protein [Tersicoccus sp. Bi-70]